MDPVKQLAHGDYADRELFAACHFIDERGIPVPLEIDEQIGVDQERHGSAGGPTLFRSSRRSSANLSSVLGALAMSSRNCSPDMNRCLGRETIATGAPLRVTSISSPLATRLRTSEKFRATSVAVILGMGRPRVSDKSDLAHLWTA